MTRFIKKKKFNIFDWNFTNIYDTICRYTFSTISKHLPFNSISTKFSPPLVSNHACEFLVGPTQNQDEETKKSQGKNRYTKRRGKFIQTSNPSPSKDSKSKWLENSFKILPSNSREREERKQYISNKEFLGKNNRPVLYTGNMRIFYGANRQLLRNIHR